MDLPPLGRSDLGGRRQTRLALALVTACLILGAPALLAPSPPERAPLDGYLVPLLGTDAGAAGEPTDLRALSRWLHEARVVGLGERHHGTHEYPQLAHRLFAHLAVEEGYSVYALEISQAHAARLDDYVQGRRDDLDDLIAQRWWPAERFYGRALRDQLIWMREHNRTAANSLHVAGFDFKHPSFAMEALVERLRAFDPAAATRVEALFERVPRQGFGVFPNVYGFHGGPSVELSASDPITSLRLGGRIRGRGVGFGQAGLGAQLGDESSLTASYLKAAELTESGTSVTVDVEIGQPLRRSTSLQVVMMHRGNGTVWFEDLFVEVNGLRIDVNGADLALRPLHLPRLQTMDYTHTIESETSIRVDCSRVVDEILHLVRVARAVVENAVRKHAKDLSQTDVAWLRQLSRLVVQSAEWRTLVENNRDVLMAENVRWLLREIFPEQRMLLFAHSSHTERIPHRMGGMLAEHFGEGYAPVTMMTAAGRWADFKSSSVLEPGDELEIHDIEIGESSLPRRLQSIGRTGSILHVAGAAAAAEARDWLSAAQPPVDGSADVVIVLEAVQPFLPP